MVVHRLRFRRGLHNTRSLVFILMGEKPPSLVSMFTHPANCFANLWRSPFSSKSCIPQPFLFPLMLTTLAPSATSCSVTQSGKESKFSHSKSMACATSPAQFSSLNNSNWQGVQASFFLVSFTVCNTSDESAPSRSSSRSSSRTSSRSSPTFSSRSSFTTRLFERVLSFINNAAPPSGFSGNFAEQVFSAVAATVAATATPKSKAGAY
mmetsp:Transcript_62170/g.122943  ORF Transcript_62170/g.122943 Transcript_62170/m.122943 type:complete len:208 (-) Transcript_62170:87-710(-)